MSQVVEIQLEWKYTPKNYLEEAIQVEEAGYTLSISNGIALAKIDSSFYEQNEGIREHLTNLIENRLYTMQIMSHKKFILSKPSQRELREDGTRHLFIEARMVASTHTAGSVDLVIQDKDGNVITDTKRERLNKQKWFAEVIDKHRTMDNTLDHMLKSYQMAVKDPNNELVYLYEIRDALSARFGNDKKAMQNLGISKKRWKIIGNLANNEPLEEGRHRGKSAGDLRPANIHELSMARKSVTSFMEKYLIFLEAD